MNYQTKSCQHVLHGKQPEYVVIKESQMLFAICMECVSGNCRLTEARVQTPEHFPADGHYLLEEGKYQREQSAPVPSAEECRAHGMQPQAGR